MLRIDLLDLGLAIESPVENWLIVDVRVADLILSMLADNIKDNRSYLTTTVSDQENTFAVAKCCEIDDNHFKENAVLATSIISSQIPDGIQNLSINSYFEIRKAYQENIQKELKWNTCRLGRLLSN